MAYVDPAACLEQPQRRLIYEQIRDRPGRTLGDLRRATGLGSGTIHWHTQKLEQAGLVVTENHFGMRLYHATANGLPGKRLGRAAAILQDRRSRGVLEIVRGGAVDVDAICKALRADRGRVMAVLQALNLAEAQSGYGLHFGLVASSPLVQS